MTADEFKAALRDLGISQRQFAIKSRSAISTVNRWAQGSQPIPGLVDWIVELLREKGVC